MKLAHLRLLQLADSALPIGGLAHSFGLESMIEEQFLSVGGLYSYLENLLQETLLVEAVFCRTAHAAATSELAELNASLSGLRLARESREASLALGKRFLSLVAALDPAVQVQEDVLHFSIAFGYAGGALLFGADETVSAFLHQNVAAFLSAAQRLLALGQMQSSRIAWDLKPLIAAAAVRSGELNIHNVSCFSHLPELASMRHPNLSTRLFIS